ncbi:MAG: hypothetical protein BYD32DRAFT_463239 [Podila humilis]|nr:MAG: hypothetical protein BYD32DRAFT_463239 [Podila humilis]
MSGGMSLAGHRPPSRDDKVNNSSAPKEMMGTGYSSTLLPGSVAKTVGVKSFKSVQISSEISSPTTYKVVIDPKVSAPMGGPAPQQPSDLSRGAPSPSRIESAGSETPPFLTHGRPSQSQIGPLRERAKFILPNVVSLVFAGGTSQTASKRRWRDLDRSSPIIVEGSRLSGGRTSKNLFRSLANRRRDDQELLGNHQDRLSPYQGQQDLHFKWLTEFVLLISSKSTMTGCSCDFFFHYTSAGGVSISQRQLVMRQAASGLRGSNKALRSSPADSWSEPSSPKARRPQHRSYNISKPLTVGPSSPPEPIAYDSSRIAKPVRIPSAKIAFMKDTLSVIEKHTVELSNGDQVRAALLLVNALLDQFTLIEGKKRHVE